MKKMKFIGFLASVIALTGCSLAAREVGIKDFTKLYDENVRGTRMVETLRGFYHSASKIPSIKNNIRIVGEEIEGKETGAKFVTSDRIEYTYRADGAATTTFTKLDTLLAVTSQVSLSVEETWIGYSYNEYRDGADNLFRGDIAQDGQQIKVMLSYTPNSDGVRFNAALTKLTYEFDEKTGKIKTSPKSRDQLVPVISGGEKTDDEDKQKLSEMVETYFTHADTTGIYAKMTNLYNVQALDYVEGKLTGEHNREILERNGNYVFRSNEDGNITEVNIVSRLAESEAATDTSAANEDSSAEASEVQAIEGSKYRVKSVIRRPGGFDGKEIDTITYTNL